MKQIKRYKTFEKHFKLRISPNEKMTKQFEQRLEQFIKGELGYPINDHSLTGKLSGKRAFSIAGDIRVVYIELEEFIIFLDIGSHNQVYR
jgi:addiction module RelE/StbE family toxin